MKDNSKVLHAEENGVELFTIIATGNSGMSQRGLARACGKRLSTVQNLINNLTDKAPSKLLKPWVGKTLTLTDETIKRNGKEIIVYHADFCSDVITHYAFLGSEPAQDIVAATNKIGLNSFIQGKTGWLPSEYQTSQESRELIDLLILAHPEKRSIHFNEEWQKEACRVTGYPWDGMPMAKFIRRSIYDRFPDVLVDRLDGVNPYVDDKRRASKHYQHFEKSLDDNVLKLHIRDVLGVLRMSPSMAHFWRLMGNRFGEGIQLDLDI